MAITITQTPLEGVLIIQPKVLGDARGFFVESYNAREFAEATGVDLTFVQDNHSRSAQGVLRGLHYQLRHPQGKLVRVVSGSVFDVAVDLRRDSPTFGHWYGVELNSQNATQLWIPPGFGHGFIVTSNSADFLYKTTDFWHADDERAVLWNDPDIAIDWPLDGIPLLSAKDLAAPRLADAEVYGGAIG
jgi:dTDP-4-dehydrorhamnose 3,5-epimerase